MGVDTDVLGFESRGISVAAYGDWLPVVTRIELVGSSPMPDSIVDGCLRLIARGENRIVDLVGLAIDRHPRFEEIVILARALGKLLIVRLDPAMTLNAQWPRTVDLLAEHGATLVVPVPWRVLRDEAPAWSENERRFMEALRILPEAGLSDGPFAADLATRPSSERHDSFIGKPAALATWTSRVPFPFRRLHVPSAAGVKDWLPLFGVGYPGEVAALAAVAHAVEAEKIVGFCCGSALQIRCDGVVTQDVSREDSAREQLEPCSDAV